METPGSRRARVQPNFPSVRPARDRPSLAASLLSTGRVMARPASKGARTGQQGDRADRLDRKADEKAQRRHTSTQRTFANTIAGICRRTALTPRARPKVRAAAAQQHERLSAGLGEGVTRARHGAARPARCSPPSEKLQVRVSPTWAHRDAAARAGCSGVSTEWRRDRLTLGLTSRTAGAHGRSCAAARLRWRSAACRTEGYSVAPQASANPANPERRPYPVAPNPANLTCKNRYSNPAALGAI